ncbi:BQ5605_C004g02801 [Microbotryum silenes-dioicae]|uniref:BQ5605_C004g02801 protein n=1 Tax=Microbotryum silenes-dioicae TaxID=796604 RepID=A0A2X0P4E4_9BASI|nr:BQ5605_C004g02801 [Microbotryum silenes-dioicae]
MTTSRPTDKALPLSSSSESSSSRGSVLSPTASNNRSPSSSPPSSRGHKCHDSYNTGPIASTSKLTLDCTSYGYGDVTAFDKQRADEYPSLKGTHYLDYAASPPVAPASVLAFHAALSKTLYANPHSRSTASVQTDIDIARTRARVLSHLFGLEDAQQSQEWDVVWTSGTTAAIKLVANAWDWKRERASLAYLTRSHTSLVGMRGVATSRGASVSCLDSTRDLINSDAALIAYPAQCNATGSRIGLDLARRIKRRSPKTSVLVDAAAYLSTSVLDLGSIPLEEAPDFVACSFYKCFGWPTGLGALIVKRSSAHLLQSDPYFGGGSISSLSVSSPAWVHPRGSSGASNPTCHERLEAGTLPFLDIIALGHSMDTHNRLYGSHQRVSAHALALTDYARSRLGQLKHANGSKVVSIQHNDSYERCGPTIGFTLYDAAGSPVGHVHLDRLATMNGFQIRTGGLCNTGVWTRAFGYTDQDLLRLHEKGRACWDDEEFDDEGRPLGVARISFGASSSREDVDSFVEFIERFFLESWEEMMLVRARTPLVEKGQPQIRLGTMTVYTDPIKSCGGQQIPEGSSWPLSTTGLEHDREWMLVDAGTGRALSQKCYPRMVLIRPRIDLITRRLHITAADMPALNLPLDEPTCDASTREAQLCGDLVSTQHVDADLDRWFSTFLGLECQLRRFPSGSTTSSRHAHFEGPPRPLLLSNESPFLLISSSSTKRVNEWISNESGHSSTSPTPISSACFRANFELTTSNAEPSRADDEDIDLPPFFEDSIDLLRIGDEFFQALGACRRCLMIGVNQETGIKTNVPFNTLARRRKSIKGRIEFGTHMIWRKDLSRSPEGVRPSIKVGDLVSLTTQDA